MVQDQWGFLTLLSFSLVSLNVTHVSWHELDVCFIRKYNFKITTHFKAFFSELGSCYRYSNAMIANIRVFKFYFNNYNSLSVKDPARQFTFYCQMERNVSSRHVCVYCPLVVVCICAGKKFFKLKFADFEVCGENACESSQNVPPSHLGILINQTFSTIELYIYTFNHRTKLHY